MLNRGIPPQQGLKPGKKKQKTTAGALNRGIPPQQGLKLQHIMGKFLYSPVCLNRGIPPQQGLKQDDVQALYQQYPLNRGIPPQQGLKQHARKASKQGNTAQ